MINTSYLIYGFLDPFTGELKYIGQSTRNLEEPRSYFKPSVRKQRRKVCSWVQSIFNKGEKPKIIVIEDNILNIDQLNELEAFYIDYFRAIGCDLKNLVPGGKSRIGQKHTLETRKKISEAGKRPCSEETKLKISLAQKGKKLAINHVTKVREAGKLRGIKVKDQNNIIYYSIQEASRKLNVDRSDISRNLKGLSKAVKGYKFQRVA